MIIFDINYRYTSKGHLITLLYYIHSTIIQILQLSFTIITLWRSYLPIIYTIIIIIILKNYC